MMKIISLVLCAFIVTITFSACHISNPSSTSSSSSMVKSERRFAKYLNENNLHNGAVVDLSEGPKLRYNANFGPKNLDFDIKIQNPY